MVFNLGLSLPAMFSWLAVSQLVSHYGDALDEKTPLLRSSDVLSEQAV